MSGRFKQWSLCLSLLLLYLIILWPIAQGYGHNWDGTYHLYRDHFENIVRNNLSAWSESNFGSPISYASGSLYVLVLGLLHLSGLPTEVQQYVYLAILLSGISFLSFKITSRYLVFPLAITFSLATVLNPAIFYKLLAGHTIYLTALFFFIFILYYLLEHYRARKRDALVLGLLSALSVMQIQFGIFSPLLILGYVIFFDRRNWPRQLAVIAAVVLLVHSYWLIPFLTSASGVVEASSVAKRDSFDDLVQASLPRVWTFLFSKATFIQHFFPRWFQALSGLLVLGVLLFFGRHSRRVGKDSWFFLAAFLLFSLIATGVPQLLQLPVLKTLLPILREVGHAAPIVTLFFFLLSASLLRDVVRLPYKIAATVILVAFTLFSAVTIHRWTPRIDMDKARSEFAPIREELEQTSDASRLLTYPFFNQYSYISQPTTFRVNTPMSNSGWDSFMIFGGYDYVSNAVSPHEFSDSLQRQFLRDYSVDRLAERNIRYIVDYSHIYRSNYHRFVGSDVYENNLKLIENDPEFLQKVIAANPDKVRRLSPHVLEITIAKPRIEGSGIVFKKLNNNQYLVETPEGVSGLTFYSSFNPNWRLYRVEDGNSLADCPSMEQLSEAVGSCPADESIITGYEFSSSLKTAAADHSETEAGFNRWDISGGSEGKGTYLLIYQPQRAFLLGLTISLSALFGGAIYSLGLLLRERKRL